VTIEFKHMENRGATYEVENHRGNDSGRIKNFNFYSFVLCDKIFLVEVNYENCSNT